MPYPSDFFALRKPRVPMPSEAIDPGIDVGSGDIPTSAFSPALQPHSDAARSPTGGANGPGMSPMDPGHQYMSDLQDVSGRLSAALSAPRPGKFRQAMGAFIGNANPGLGGLISGETQRQRTIEPLQQEYGVLSQLITANRQQQLAQGTLDKDQATADYLRGRNPTAENVANTRAGASKDVANIRGDSAMDVAGLKADSAESIASQKIANPKLNDFEQFYKDYLDANKITDGSRARLAARREYAAAGQPPQRSPQQLAIGPDGKVIELKPGVQVPQGTKSVSADLGSAKTTADEQRRADLAANLNENLDQLEEIAKRRPDLFGPMAGRMTSAKQFVGTSDPDVAALKVIQEQTGMAMVGAHAMRNAQHVETAANSIMNAYRNDPKAIIGPGGSIEKARASLKTFLEKQPVVGGTAAGGGGTSGAQSAPPPGAKIRDYTQLGN